MTRMFFCTYPPVTPGPRRTCRGPWYLRREGSSPVSSSESEYSETASSSFSAPSSSLPASESCRSAVPSLCSLNGVQINAIRLAIMAKISALPSPLPPTNDDGRAEVSTLWSVAQQPPRARWRPDVSKRIAGALQHGYTPWFDPAPNVGVVGQ